MSVLINSGEYLATVEQIKQDIKAAQYHASIQMNTELVMLYHSIGLLLCKSKNDLVAEYSLKDMSKPIGVSAYQITSNLPEELGKQLPSVEDIQKRITGTTSK